MVKLPEQLQDHCQKDLARITALNLDRENTTCSFWFRVDGTSNKRSDIDVGIDGAEAIPEKSLMAIRNAVGFATLFKIDVVDFTRAKPQFKEVALKHIERFHFNLMTKNQALENIVGSDQAL